MIPFDAKIEGKSDIKNYSDYLFRNAGGAILSWIIEGAADVIKRDFKIPLPACVQRAIKQYREDNDWLGHFLNERCEIGDGLQVKSGELYSAYRTFCSDSFTITAPSSAVPSISVAAARINNSVPSSWGIYVQGQSGVTITATASGYQGSTISSYTISGGATGTQTSNVFTISKIYTSGTITYTVKATDSRGRTATASVSISVVAYSAPAFSATDAFRCVAGGTASDTGTYISAKATGTYASVSNKNSMSLKVQYTLSTSEAYSTAVTLTNGRRFLKCAIFLLICSGQRFRRPSPRLADGLAGSWEVWTVCSLP